MQEADSLKETPQEKNHDYLRGQAAPWNRANTLHQKEWPPGCWIFRSTPEGTAELRLESESWTLRDEKKNRKFKLFFFSLPFNQWKRIRSKSNSGVKNNIWNSGTSDGGIWWEASTKTEWDFAEGIGFMDGGKREQKIYSHSWKQWHAHVKIHKKKNCYPMETFLHSKRAAERAPRFGKQWQVLEHEEGVLSRRGKSQSLKVSHRRTWKAEERQCLPTVKVEKRTLCPVTETSKKEYANETDYVYRDFLW